TSLIAGLASQVSVATSVTVTGKSLWFGGKSCAGVTLSESSGGVVSTTATWVSSSSVCAYVSIRRSQKSCDCPTPSDWVTTSVWPTSGPTRPLRQLVTAMLSSGSVAAPWSVKDAPPVDVHSTVWSAPATAEGGWFTSAPSAETSTVISWESSSANSHGPPTSSQSGESAVHGVAPSPAHVPSGFSPSTVEARLPCKSQSRAPQSRPSLSGSGFEPR